MKRVLSRAVRHERDEAKPFTTDKAKYAALVRLAPAFMQCEEPWKSPIKEQDWIKGSTPQG
jgi:hypothetical protein